MTNHLDRGGDIRARCREALLARAREVRDGAAFLDGFPGYFAQLGDNLVPGVTADQDLSDYGGGAGAELGWSLRGGRRTPPKMQAVHSSSALVVNSFGPWKGHLDQLALGGHRGFASLRFEAKVSTGLGGIPPHLDVLAERATGATVGIESKATEYLGGHRGAFAASYGKARWPSGLGPYVDVMTRMVTSPDLFRYLDAAQLVKHAFGLGVQFMAREVTLLYTFWEPANADEFPEFEEHRREARRFAELVAGSSVQFTWTTYSDLWRVWSNEPYDWLRRHAQHLIERYSVEI